MALMMVSAPVTVTPPVLAQGLVDQTGMVTLGGTARTGVAVTASVTDPDAVTESNPGGTVTPTTWEWGTAVGRDGNCFRGACHWFDALGDGANTATYTPAAAESGLWLRVVASYTDVDALTKTVASAPVQVTGPPAALDWVLWDIDSPYPYGSTFDSLSVSWPVTRAAPPVSGYTVQWRRASDPDIDASYSTAGVSHTGTDTKALISDLPAYRTGYVVRARASNSLGDSSWVSAVFYTSRLKPSHSILPAAENADPRGLWSDGETLWVADGGDAVLYRYSLADRTATPTTFATPGSDGGNRGVWSDNETVWVASIGSASLTAGLVSGDSSRCTQGDRCVQAYDMASGYRRGQKDIPLNRDDPVGLWSDSSIMWVTTESHPGDAYAFDLVSGEPLGGRDIDILAATGADRAFNSALGVWSDGVSLWAAVNVILPSESSRVRVLPLDGSRRESDRLDHRISVSPWYAVGIWSDRETLWVSPNGRHLNTTRISAYVAQGAVANSSAFFGAARFEDSLDVEVVENTSGYNLDLRPGDAEFDTLTLGELHGADASLFEMDSDGVITPKPSTEFDYHQSGDNTYELEVTVSDSLNSNGNPDTAADATLAITITIIPAPTNPAKATPNRNGVGSTNVGGNTNGSNTNGGSTNGGSTQTVECPSEGASHPFTDVPRSSLASDAVNCLYELGVTTGRTPTTYDPNGNVTRAQMAVFLSRLYTIATGQTPPVAHHTFTDVADSSARDHIARIFGLGITTGRTPTTYDPNGNVTRSEMAVFLSRLYTIATGQTPPVAHHTFTDVADSSARDHIARIFGLGITTGRTPTTYDPNGNVTRSEMAVFLSRLYTVATAQP